MTDQEKRVAAFVHWVRMKLTGDEVLEALRLSSGLQCATYFDSGSLEIARQILGAIYADASPNWDVGDGGAEET